MARHALHLHPLASQPGLARVWRELDHAVAKRGLNPLEAAAHLCDLLLPRPHTRSASLD